MISSAGDIVSKNLKKMQGGKKGEMQCSIMNNALGKPLWDGFPTTTIIFSYNLETGEIADFSKLRSLPPAAREFCSEAEFVVAIDTSNGHTKIVNIVFSKDKHTKQAHENIKATINAYNSLFWP